MTPHARIPLNQGICGETAFLTLEEESWVIWRIPSVRTKASGWMANASASRPRSSVGAGVLRNSSLTQYTREWRAARVPCQPRSLTIRSSGTRSPAPHQAAIKISGSIRLTFSAVVCSPGFARNSPPAASTSSATQVCEAIKGLPHSSQNTRGWSNPAVRARTSSTLFCISTIKASPRSPAPTAPAIRAMSA